MLWSIQLNRAALLVSTKIGPAAAQIKKRRLEYEVTQDQDSFTQSSFHLLQQVAAPVKERSFSCDVLALFWFQRQTFEDFF